MAGSTDTEAPAEVSTVPTDAVLTYADKIAKEQGVAPELVKGIILSENSGNNGIIPKILRTDRVSPRGAYGVGQTMDSTHQNLKTQGYLPEGHSLDTWQGQVEATVATLKEMQRTHRTNDPAVIAAAYNGGTAAAKNVAAGNYSALPQETIDYLTKLHKLGVASQGTAGAGTGTVSGRIRPAPISSDQMAGAAGTPAPSSVSPTGVPTVAISSISESAPPADTGRGTINRGIDALMELVNENAKLLTNMASDITGSTADAVRIHQDAAQKVEEAGNAEADAERVRAMIEAAGRDTRERVLGIANLDTRKTDNAFSTALAERAVIRTNREMLAKDIDERQGVGFFDSPLDWLINQTVLPGKVSQHNALARQERDNISRVQTLQREVTTQENLDMGATSDYLLKLGNAAARAKIATGQARADEIRAGASALTAQKVLGLARVRETQFSQAESALKWGIEIERRADANNLKADEAKQIADFNQRATTIGNLIGAEGVNWNSLKGRGAKVQNDWKTRTDSLSLGDSLGEAAEFVRTYGNTQVMRQKGAGELADMFTAINKNIDARAQDIKNTWAVQHPELATKPPKDVDARAQAAAQLQLNWESQRDNDMTRADPINPYAANHHKMALVYDGYHGNPNNPVYQMVKDAQQRNQKIDDKALMGATLKLVETGILQPREAAAAVNEYYSYVIRANNEGRSLNAAGLGTQTNYNMRPEPKLRGFNAVNFTQAENFFTQFAAKRAAETRGVYGIDLETQEFVVNPSGIGYHIEYKKKQQTPEEKILEEDKRRREKENQRGMSGVRG